MSDIAEPPAAPAPGTAAPANTPPAQPLPPPPGAFTAAALAKARAPKTEPVAPAPAPAPIPAQAPVTPTNNAPPAAPATPTAPATEPATPAELPEHFSNANASNWKRAREVIKEWETKAKTYAEQSKVQADEIVKLKSKPQVDPEFQAKYDTLKKERDELNERDERNNMANRADFQAAYDVKMDAKVAAAKALVGDKGEQLAAILAAPDGKWRTAAMKELVADMDAYDQGQIGRVVGEHDEIRADRAARLANSKEEMKLAREVDAQRRAEHEKKATAARENNLNYALQKAREVEAFKPIEGNTAHNEAVAANEVALKKFLTTVGTKDMTLDDFIQAPIQAAESNRLKGVVEALTKERDELKKAVAEFMVANPGMRGGAANNNPAGETVPTPFGQSRFVADAMSRIRGK